MRYLHRGLDEHKAVVSMQWIILNPWVTECIGLGLSLHATPPQVTMDSVKFLKFRQKFPFNGKIQVIALPTRPA